jgi:hypothetical protein
MKITLDTNPSDAPCCIKLIAEDGSDMIIQTDYDWPGIASSFGWSTRHCNGKSTLTFRSDSNVEDMCNGTPYTDGTVDCPRCNKPAREFIQEAREYIDDHDGDSIEDPGYYDSMSRPEEPEPVGKLFEVEAYVRVKVKFKKKAYSVEDLDAFDWWSMARMPMKELIFSAEDAEVDSIESVKEIKS